MLRTELLSVINIRHLLIHFFVFSLTLWHQTWHHLSGSVTWTQPRLWPTLAQQEAGWAACTCGCSRRRPPWSASSRSVPLWAWNRPECRRCLHLESLHTGRHRYRLQMSTHLHFNFQVGFGACARVRLTWLDRNRCVGVDVILCSALLLLVDDWNDERSTHWSCCHDDSSIENKSVHTLFMLSINQEYLMYAQQLYNKKSLHTQTLSPQSKYRFTLMFNWIIIVFTANFWRKFLEIDACN